MDPEFPKSQLHTTPAFSSTWPFAFERLGFQCNAGQLGVSENMIVSNLFQTPQYMPLNRAPPKAETTRKSTPNRDALTYHTQGHAREKSTKKNPYLLGRPFNRMQNQRLLKLGFPSLPAFHTSTQIIAQPRFES